MSVVRLSPTWRAILVVLGISLAAPGCGPSQPVPVPVRGRVTYEGHPVATGSVMFTSTNKTLPNARGRLQEDGSFQLTTFEPDDGAVPGEYKVTIRAFKTGPGLDTSFAPPIPLVPRQYTTAGTTPIVKTIEQRDLNVIEIQL